MTDADGRSLVVRATYFLLVGWWATGLWLAAAWLLSLTVVGIPLAVVLVNRVPYVLTLKERRAGLDAEGRREQYPLLLRAAYFLLVGWWASGVWASVAYGFAVTVVGLPVAVWMAGYLPFVVSLYRY